MIKIEILTVKQNILLNRNSMNSLVSNYTVHIISVNSECNTREEDIIKLYRFVVIHKKPNDNVYPNKSKV